MRVSVGARRHRRWSDFTDRCRGGRGFCAAPGWCSSASDRWFRSRAAARHAGPDVCGIRSGSFRLKCSPEGEPRRIRAEVALPLQGLGRCTTPTRGDDGYGIPAVRGILDHGRGTYRSEFRLATRSVRGASGVHANRTFVGRTGTHLPGHNRAFATVAHRGHCRASREGREGGRWTSTIAERLCVLGALAS